MITTMRMQCAAPRVSPCRRHRRGRPKPPLSGANLSLFQPHTRGTRFGGGTVGWWVGITPSFEKHQGKFGYPFAGGDDI